MATAVPLALALDRRTVPWLFASALATTGPHAFDLPPLLIAAVSLFFVWGAWLWWRGTRLPGRWLLMLCVAAYTLGIVVEYRTLFGRDPGVAMLAGFMVLKMLELKSRRDAHVMTILGYFLLLTHYFYSQSVLTGIWMLASCLLLTATLIRVSGGVASLPILTLRYAGLLMVQGLPFMLVLYLFFPRISGPIWGLPEDAFRASSGLSDTMEPGSIAELARNGAIAFRAHFKEAAPPRNQLYWRGPVMEDYDGARWKPAPSRDLLPTLEPQGPEYEYALTLEAHNKTWVLALDAPGKIPPNTRIDARLTVLADQPLHQRTLLELSAFSRYRFNIDESPQTLQQNRQIPSWRNPKAQALATRWRMESTNPDQIVAKALQMFREQPFFYTLRPPLLGTHGIDDFLFNTRRGFCEHYASAFVVLMRAAGVPARVISGYQGGELNPLDGYYVIRQSDAHAWAEVWLADRGWVRVDPTAAVSPSRIEQDIAAALPDGEPLPVLIQMNADWLRDLRFRWEAVNNAWNQYVLGYNPERQRELLARLGLPDADWKALGAILVGFCGFLLTGLIGWTIYQRPRLDPPQREWNKALRHLRRRKVEIHSWEAPLALAKRLEREQPELANAFRIVAEHYCAARYGNDASALTALKALVQAIP